MPSPLNINNITPPRVPLTDPRTGLISREWYRFFLNLFRLTGEGSNAVSLDDLQIGPPHIPSDAIQFDPNDPTNSPSDSPLLSQIDEIDKQLNALESQSDTLAADLNAEAQKQIDGLEVTPPDQAKNFNAEAQKRFDGLESVPPNEAQDLNAETQKSINALQIVPQPPLGTMAQLQQADLPWITFNTAPDFTPPTVGTVAWDGGTTLGVQMTTNVLGRLMESLFIYVKASAAITKGDVVVEDGAVGASGVLKAKPAPLNTADATLIIGIAAESIPLNGFGLIQTHGYLSGLNTTGSSVGETWADGNLLYYNPAYVGGLTNVKPTAPNIKLPMGQVVNASSGGSGSLIVAIGQSSVLGGTDSNVQFGTLTDKDLIQYDSTAQYWKNVSPSTVTVGTATNLAGGAAGSVPYQTGAGATTFLGIGSALQVLKVNAGATAPEWVSGAALTKTDDTNVTLTLGGTPATSLLAATSLTLGWTGQLSLTRGGTNASLTASAGSVAYSTASALALNTAGNSGDWLKSGGTAAPSWTAPAALTKTDDTNVTLTLGGSASTALLNAASLTLGWTGQLSAARGGTGTGSYTVGDILYADTSSSLAKLADVATGNALISGGVGTAPSWGKIGLTTHVSGTLPVANGGTGIASGTSGGVPYFSGATTIASSAALAANAIVLGGGAGAAPATTTTGTGVVTAIGNAVNTTGGLVTQSGTLTANALLLGGGSGTAISSTTTGTGVVTAIGNATNGASGLAVLNASGYLAIAQGGTNSNATPTAGGVGYGTGTAHAYSAAGTSNQVLISNGASAPSWSNLSSLGVTSFSAGTTGFTPNSATTGAVTLGGTLATTNGGTGLTSFTANGVVYASSTSALATGTGLQFDGTNLGLGVTPSAWGASLKAFDVAGTVGGSIWGNTGGATGQAWNAYYDGTNWKYKATNSANTTYNNASGFAWYLAPSGTAGNAITFTQAMTLDASGNLGVGTTSPALRIHGAVAGTAGARIENTASTGSAYWQSKNTATTCNFGVDATGGYIETLGAYSTLFYTNGSERARITSGGYFKASDNGTYLGSTGIYHEFRQSASNYSNLVVGATNTSFTENVIYIYAARNTTNNSFYALSYYNTTASAFKFQVADSGNVTNTNGSYGTISDAKMKTDIVDAGSQWADIKAIRFRKFKMKDDPEQIVQLGVVAQELEKTSPGLVEEHTDRDNEGNDLGTTTKSVKTSILLMKAAVALQEAMARIEQLEAKVTALEEK